MLALVAVAGQAQRIDSVPEMACKRFEVPAVPATTSHQACVTTAQFLILSPPVAEGLHPIIRGSHAVQPVLPRALSRSVMDRLKRNPLFQVAHEPHSSTEELSKRILDVSNSLPIDEDESQEMGKAGKQEAEEDNEIVSISIFIGGLTVRICGVPTCVVIPALYARMPGTPSVRFQGSCRLLRNASISGRLIHASLSSCGRWSPRVRLPSR
eukprot:scpid53485/ scgid1206/ 